MAERTQIFISYSHADERWRKRVAGHLAVLEMEGIIDLWDDRQLEAGQDWFERINERMFTARIALLLISSEFLTSKFIREEEVPKLFERHIQGGMTIYPLLVKPCPWQEVQWLARWQVRPRDGRSVSSFRGSRVDEVLVEVAREISTLAKRSAPQPLPPKKTSPPLRSPNPQCSIGLQGVWRAEVTYDWPNAQKTEEFRFEVEGSEVLGTATFLGVPRTIWEGKLTDGKLTFVTKTLEASGGEEPRESRHHYRGQVGPEALELVMRTEGGYSEHVPIRFVARKCLAA